MGSFARDVLIYVIGGVTFVPLVVAAILLHIFLTSKPLSSTPATSEAGDLHDQNDDGYNIRRGSDATSRKLRKPQEKETGGYFAVSREWIHGGVNGKPPERKSPAGEVIAEESPSVYQSMYRSLFDRRQAPTLEVAKTADGRPLKRASNVFYVVLRHGHLMLYDDSDQIEVRYVISLAHHDAKVYGGGEDIPEGELWIKRNAICLARKVSVSDMSEVVSKPFYLFSENCSEKEDFYFALLQHQERNASEDYPPPLVQHFELKHIIKLVQTLHSSEEHLQTRWFNALLGRLFLSIYKTSEVEQFIRTKITKKISRVNKPAIISGIKLQKIDLGESAPYVTNPKLKDLNVDGDCCVEADIRYDGKFRIEIATTVKFDLGTRFKAREVNVVLAITVKKLEGHFMLRFKPPPSNRVWYTFEQMPRMELQIEPVVSSRQITWSIIHRAIESRIREVFAETLVVPHWDDSPFLSTLDQHFRGGIWVHELQHFQAQTETVVPDESGNEPDGDEARAAMRSPLSPKDGAESVASEEKPEKSNQRLFRRKPVKSQGIDSTTTSAASSSIDKDTDKPRAIRSNSFAAAASPIVSSDNVVSEPISIEASSKKKRDAASFMSEISSRSQPSSPSFASPMRDSQEEQASSADTTQSSDTSSRGTPDLFSRRKSSIHSQDGPPLTGIRKPSTTSSGSKDMLPPPATRLQNVTRTLTPSARKQQSLGAAAVAAKTWGWKTLSKAKPPGTPSPTSSIGSGPGTPTQPMGRGQPLPPPGQPLPHPKELKSPTPPKKSPTPPELPLRRPKPRVPSQDAGRQLSQPKARPPQIEISESEPQGDGIMVVEAPIDSGPSSPAFADDDSYGEFLENVKTDDESERHDEKHDETVEEHPTDGQDHAEDLFRFDAEVPPAEQHPAGKLDLAEAREHEEPALPIPHPPSSPSNSTKLEGADAEDMYAAWKAGEEQEARSKSVWMAEQEHP